MKGTVLIVDDSATIRSRFEWLLSNHGFSVETAENGLSALSELAEQKPDLILLDIYMPGMDGIQVCEAIRVDPSHRDLPILIISGVGRGDINKAIEAGATDFLVKPVGDDEVLRAVDLHLARIA